MLRRFRGGTRRASPVTRRVLVIVPSLSPRRSGLAASARLRRSMLPSALRKRARLSGASDFRGHLCDLLSFRPNDSLPSQRWFVDGLQGFGLPPPCRPATGLLTFTPVGLSPTERASFSWAHFRTSGFPQYGFKASLSGRAFPVDRTVNTTVSQKFDHFGLASTRWVRQVDRDAGQRQDGLTTAEQEDLRRLRRENRTLREERAILERAAAWFARETGSIPSTDSVPSASGGALGAIPGRAASPRGAPSECGSCVRSTPRPASAAVGRPRARPRGPR